MQVPTHGPIGIGIPGRQTGTAHGALRITTKLLPCFLNRYMPGFLTEGWTRGKREEHDTCSDRTQALKIQFPDDEMRCHEDRTGKQHDRFLGGAVDEEDEHFQVMKKFSRTTMSILMHWPRHKKTKQKLWHLSPQKTEHCVKLETNNIRYERHVVIFLNNTYSEIVTIRDQNGSASSVSVHIGLHSAMKNWGNQLRRREKRQPTQRTANSLWQFTQKRACSQRKRWKQEKPRFTVVLPNLRDHGKHWIVWHV